ncbi:serine hydrolase, partial [Steroidobacter sp.]|uniref:serine hydrolase n=1 Tax=Steroidobacter sp. TaxID=1978227 RepID=UPI001A4A65FF
MQEKREDAGVVRNLYAGKLFPARQLELFRNKGWMFPQREIARGARIHPLPYSASQLSDVTTRSGDNRYDLADYISRNRVAGLLVLKDGKIVFEHYDAGNDDSTQWVSMSLAKSITTTLVGAAVRDKLIRSVDDPLIRYLPELVGTGYEGVAVRDLL